MKLPNDVREILARRFKSKHREWLKASLAEIGLDTSWPLEIGLDAPTEQNALKQSEGVRAWISRWKSWQGPGVLVWSDRRWRSLGTQSIPERLILNNPTDVAVWIGEGQRWSRAVDRFRLLIQRWPTLADVLPRHFSVLADYDDSDFICLSEILSWICSNPNSNLYLRQIPVAGVDSKWLESRKGLVSELVTAIQGPSSGDGDFYTRCGLRRQPQLIRMRILDPELRNHFGGLSDISAPWEEIANLSFKPSHAFIVENLQTGLAFEELTDSVVIMRLGYGVDVLGRVPWLQQARCIYWGDIDTHGFAILNRARTYLPNLTSVLMEEATLLDHRKLWGEEKVQHSATELPLLTSTEQALFRSLKDNVWGQQVRLEQERLRWDVAWRAIKIAISEAS